VSAATLPEALLAALAEIREEQRAMHAELRALRAEFRKARAEPALLAALEDYFGESRFTAASLLKLANEEPHCPVSVAIADLINMNAPPKSRAIQLGGRLKRMAEIEVIAKSHGTLVYRLRVDFATEPTQSPHPSADTSDFESSGS